MAHLRAQFEKELKYRISLKKLSNITEETALLKTCKYYDLSDSGLLNKEQFFKVVEKLGFMIFSKEDIYSIFNIYAIEGKLNYRQFSQVLFQGALPQNRGFSPVRNTFADIRPEEIVLRIRKKIRDQGNGAFLNFYEQLHRLGPQITYEDFNVKLSPLISSYEEIRHLFSYFDLPKAGYVMLSNVINAIRGPIGYVIEEKLNHVFRVLSKGKKQLDPQIVYNQFCECAQRYEKDQVIKLQEQFLERLKQYFNLTNISPQQFTQETFTEFNYLLYFDLADEQSFVTLMDEIYINTNPQISRANINYTQLSNSSAKKLNPILQDQLSPTPAKKLEFRDDLSQTSGSKMKLDIDEIVYSLRQNIVRRGVKAFINLSRQLRIKDQDCDGKVTQLEFKRALADYHIEVSDSEEQVIFSTYGQQGRLSIDLFISKLVGELPERKLGLVDEIFSLLDRDWDDVVLLNDIKNNYSARYHPDVRKGRKSESEILAEFLDTFEAHHNLYSSIREPRVLRKEFRAFYSIVGAVFNDDETFQTILKGTYKNLFDQANTSNSQLQQSKFSVNQTAPFGTSDKPTDYGTSLRPSSSTKKPPQSAQKDIPAGVPSWPGFLNQTTLSGFKNRQSQEAQEILEALQTKIRQRGLRGALQLIKGFLKQISNQECLRDGFQKHLTRLQIGQAFQELRFNLENRQIYEIMGRGETVPLNTLFLNLFGTMSEYRLDSVKKAYYKLNQGNLTVDKIKSQFNPKNHPDVTKGQRSEDEILVQFFDTFEQHFNIYFGERSSNVTLDQFENYYQIVSMLYPDDRYFLQIVNSAWGR